MVPAPFTNPLENGKQQQQSAPSGDGSAPDGGG